MGTISTAWVVYNIISVICHDIVNISEVYAKKNIFASKLSAKCRRRAVNVVSIEK